MAAAGLDPGVWTGWLAYLSKAATRDGCYHLPSLGSLSVCRRLEAVAAAWDDA